MPRKKINYNTFVPLGYTQALEKLVEDNQSKDKLARLAFRALIQTAMTRERREHAFWFGLSRKSLHASFGSDWSRIKQLAVATGLLQINGSYFAGNCGNKDDVEAYPQSARLASCYRSGAYEKYEFSKKPRKSQEKESTRGPIEDWLFGKLPQFQLSDEYEPDSLWESFSANAWREKKWYGVVCPYGRLHTNATAISRLGRQHLRISTDEPLVNLDIANSQPLILGAVLGDLADPSEVRRWTAICEAGQAYECMLESVHALKLGTYKVRTPERVTQLGNDKIVRLARSWAETPAEWGRKQIKKNFLVMLFGGVDQTRQSPVYKAFAGEFPSMAAAILQIKSKGYQSLARRCQRLESDILIRSVGARLMGTLSDRPAATIYDSWLVAESDGGIVRDAITAEFTERGMTPCIAQE